VPERVRADGLVDAGLASEAADDSPRGVAIQPLPVATDEDWALDPLAEGQVDGAGRARRQRNRDDLAALAQHRQGPVAALDA